MVKTLKQLPIWWKIIQLKNYFPIKPQAISLQKKKNVRQVKTRFFSKWENEVDLRELISRDIIPWK